MIRACPTRVTVECRLPWGAEWNVPAGGGKAGTLAYSLQSSAGLPEMLSHWAGSARERAFLPGWSSRHAHVHSAGTGAGGGGMRPRAWRPRARAAPRLAACRLARSGRGQGERMCACADAGSKLGELGNACICTSGMVGILAVRMLRGGFAHAHSRNDACGRRAALYTCGLRTRRPKQAR